MVLLCDLDGVIWLSAEPIPGSAEAVERVRAAGTRVLFLTNNSARKVDELVTKLGDMGIPTEPDDIVTSAQAAVRLLEPGATAFVCAGPGVEEALAARGVKAVKEGGADAVVVGFNSDFTFKVLTDASAAVRNGARLVATNDDATYPTPEGPIPGGGAILAAVATASEAEAEIAGKPFQPMADEVRARMGGGHSSLEGAVFVGDRPSTDGLMARRLGIPFALVLSGITKADRIPDDPAPDFVADDLGSLIGAGGELPSENSSAKAPDDRGATQESA